MIDDPFIVSVERLRDDLVDLKLQVRRRYSRQSNQVVSPEIKGRAARLAEGWIAKISQHPAISQAISADVLGNLGVEFQRLLTYSEKSVIRSKYDIAIGSVLTGFTGKVIMPLRMMLNRRAISIGTSQPVPAATFVSSAFVGHSFDNKDREVVDLVIDTLMAIGISVETGAKPRADLISDKIKGLIDKQHFFVGIFTRRDKIARRQEWTPSAWIVDEKAYAYARGKKLVLLKENGVGTIGGIQGDYEYIGFSRSRLELAVVRLLQIMEIRSNGFR